MKDIDIEQLFTKRAEGKLSEEEETLLETWYWQYNENEPGPTEEEIEASMERVRKRLPQSTPVKKIRRLAHIPLIAASVALITIFGLFLLKSEKPPVSDTANDIRPGGYKAILVLANGVNIDLSEAKNGEIAKDRGVKIIKMMDGQLDFKFNPDPVVQAKPTDRVDSVPALVSAAKTIKDGSGLNVMLTPRGGQYHIALPDGTNVWINAGSTLKFPSSFADMPERRVYLTGEAYFEVAQVKSIFGMQKRARRVPFIVQTDKQEITVLGTHFNVNSYTDEPNIKTTLLEGLVKVSSKAGEATLKPGMELINNGSAIHLKKADVDMAVAWKNGEFMFRNEKLQSLMRKVSRWYNVQVNYQDKDLREVALGGTISKYSNISKVLAVLESTGEVKFKIKGRTITATR